MSSTTDTEALAALIGDRIHDDTEGPTVLDEEPTQDMRTGGHFLDVTWGGVDFVVSVTRRDS